MKKSKKAIVKVAFWSIVSLLILAPLTAKAVTADPALGDTLGLGSADLKETVIKIVQWALGLLALVAVIMIIVGGFQWMTAGGNEEKVDKAKKLISAAVIGLIIVLLAWAIVIFVIGVTNNATT
ncbi:hypothetical protein FJ208_01820 [Candidatus Gribaldobacteria bacterium]|nr:hypothetical protein [Candidatus Gribaldobacteria bacterium]